MNSGEAAKAVVARARAPGSREARSRIVERRNLPGSGSALAIRAAAPSTSGGIEGYGARFNDETVIAGLFRERILPGAFKDSVATDDIRVAFNHSANHILGRRSADTASFSEDSHGLLYRATPPSATWANDLLQSIKRRDITGSSFQFEVERDDDEEWDFTPTKQGKLPLRTIKRARVFEVGPVAWPAYENTTVSARSGGGFVSIDVAERELQLLEMELELGIDRSRRPTRTRSRHHPPVELLELELPLLEMEVGLR